MIDLASRPEWAARRRRAPQPAAPPTTALIPVRRRRRGLRWPASPLMAVVPALTSLVLLGCFLLWLVASGLLVAGHLIGDLVRRCLGLDSAAAVRPS